MRCDKSDLWVRSCRNDAIRFFALIHPEDVEAVIEKVKTTKSISSLKAGIAIFIHQRIGLA
jgi:hypothetical protein